MSEKRKSPRVPISMNVSSEEDSDTLGFGYAQNISEVGLAVDAEALADDQELPTIGSNIRMRFKLPKGALVITTTGKIVRVDPSGKNPIIAIEFVGLSHEFRTEIQRYVGSVLAR